jgi:sigma-E factor negative regulatory protein RseB
MMRKALVGAVAFSLALPALAGDAVDWLVKMSDAARSGTYQGVVVYRGNDLLETFRVTHRNLNGQELERVQSLNGTPRDILKQGNQIICLLPRDRRMTASRQPTPKGIFPQLTAERINRMTQIYRLDDLGEARIAGRVCRGIAITPRDEFRYGYEMWADAQTAVPLKVNLIGRDGSTLEQMMFTEVAFPASIPDVAFEMPKEDATRELVTRTLPGPNPTPPTASAVSTNWTFDHLPPGFKVTMREVRELPDHRGTVEHLLLSDGISAISIFTTHGNPSSPPRPMSQIGAVHAYGRMLGQTRVTVVGEAPAETIRMIGDGLRATEDASPEAATTAAPAKP